MTTKKKPTSPQLKPYRFKKGVSGNPKGRPPAPAFEREAAKLTHQDLVKQLTDLWFRNVEELQGMLPSKATKDDPKAEWRTVPAGKAAVAAILLNAIKEGDPKRLDMILNRVVGKPAETIKLIGAFDHKHTVSVPVAMMLADPAIAVQARAVAQFAAMKMQPVIPQTVDVANHVPEIEKNTVVVDPDEDDL